MYRRRDCAGAWRSDRLPPVEPHTCRSNLYHCSKWHEPYRDGCAACTRPAPRRSTTLATHPHLIGLPIDVQQLRAVIKEGPHGGTPLTEAVDRLIAAIAPVAATLSAQGQQAAVILATDGGGAQLLPLHLSLLPPTPLHLSLLPPAPLHLSLLSPTAPCTPVHRGRVCAFPTTACAAPLLLCTGAACVLLAIKGTLLLPRRRPP